MKGLIDTIFGPIHGWLQSILDMIQQLAVPVSRPINPTDYFGYLVLLGPYWFAFVTTICMLAFLYVVAYLIVSGWGIYLKFKTGVKWW